MTLKNQICSKFPLQNKNFSYSLLNIEELISIWNISKYDSPEKYTCRPIIEKSIEDIDVTFRNSLENNVNIGIFENGSLLGKITLFDVNERNRSVEIGYYILPIYRNKGVMKTSLSFFLPLLFEFNILKVYAQTASFNHYSINLLYSLSFKQDGILRNHHELNGLFYDDYIFSLLSKDMI